MNSENEYAPQFSQKEYHHWILKNVLVVLTVCLITYFWLLPLMLEWLSVIHCREVLGMQGSVFLLYAKYLGVPAIIAVIMGSVLSWQGVQVYQQAQLPLRDVKVFRKTRIIRGKQARIRGLAMIIVAPLVFFMLVPWSFYKIEQEIMLIDFNQMNYFRCVDIYNAESTL